MTPVFFSFRRQYAVGQSTRANLIFDSLLSKVIKRLVNTKELDVEDIYRTQSDRRFTATNGRIGDMSQLIRKRNFNLYETSDTLFLIGKMQFDSFKVKEVQLINVYVVNKNFLFSASTTNTFFGELRMARKFKKATFRWNCTARLSLNCPYPNEASIQ